MSEQRDELAQRVMSVSVRPDLLDYRGDYDSGAVCLGDAQRIADKILAAGYRKPRTITTVDDLIELGNGSVILDSDGDVSQRRGNYWCGYEMANLDDRMMSKCLPATVLYEPTP